jgi:hypothetical protein
VGTNNVFAQTFAQYKTNVRISENLFILSLPPKASTKLQRLNANFNKKSPKNPEDLATKTQRNYKLKKLGVFVPLWQKECAEQVLEEWHIMGRFSAQQKVANRLILVCLLSQRFCRQ